jgi:DNA polymerase III subunit delta'
VGFTDIVGQDRALLLLRRAIDTDRLPHGLLFTGPRGVGRFRTAVTVAKAVNCLGGLSGDCCDRCSACVKIPKGIHPDVHMVTPDGATIKIDQIRTLNREAALRPYEGRRKVFILDQAETMTPQAQNALLKTLEEPPGKTILFLIAPETAALLSPIASRCSQIRFAPLSENVIVSRLRADGCDEEEAGLLAGLAGGSLGRAHELRQRPLQEIWDLVEQAFALPSGKSLPPLELAERVLRHKEMLPLFLEALLVWCRDSLVSRVSHRAALLAHRGRASVITRQSQRFTPGHLVHLHRLVQQTLNGLSHHANPRLTLEVMLLKFRDLQAA